jgi:hypothetical protein
VSKTAFHDINKLYGTSLDLRSELVALRRELDELKAAPVTRLPFK